MARNDFYLTYKYTGNTVKVLVRNEKSNNIIAENGEIDTHNSGVYFEVDIYDALRMSVGKPWSLDKIKFVITSVEEQKEHILFNMCNEQIKVTVDVMLTPFNDLLFDCQWENVSQDTLKDLMLGIAIPARSHHNLKVIIPPVVDLYGVNENGELSGEHINNGGYVAEEHRLTLPVVSVANMKHSSCTNMAIFSLPSRFKTVSSWSLGFVKQEGTFYMLLLSGTVMYEGQKDKILADKTSVVEYDRGYFDLAPGETVSKKFFVSGWRDSRDKNEITNLLDKCYNIYRPKGLQTVPVNDYIKYKRTALVNRFYDDGVSVGYTRMLSLTNTVENNVESSYSESSADWTIENLRAAWCDAAASLTSGDREGIIRAKKCIEFFVKSSPVSKRGLRQLYYNKQDQTWRYSRKGDVILSDEFGRLLCYIADIILLFKQYFLEVPEEWMSLLIDGCNFLCTKRRFNKTGLYPEFWNADGSVGSKDKSSSGMTCICALSRAYKITRNNKYLRYASNCLFRYYDAVIETNTPFYEKKKFYEIRDCSKISYANFIVAAMDCFESTDDERCLKAALSASEWLALYVNVIGYPLKSESKLGKTNIDTVGSSIISSNEQCCDWLFPYYELKILADETDNAIVKKVYEITTGYAFQQFATDNVQYGYFANGEQPHYVYNTNWSHELKRDEWRGGCSDVNDLSNLCWNLKQALKLQARDKRIQKEY